MRTMLFKAFNLSETDEYHQFIFEFAISAILSTIKYWYDNGKQIPTEEMVALLRSMLMNGPMGEIIKRTNIINNFLFN